MNRSLGARLPAGAALLLCAGVVVAAAACSSRPGFVQNDPQFDGQDAAVGEPQGPCGIHCSRDLKEVLDGCEGAETVVARCNADQGCGDGKCVDACTAAVLTKGSAGCDFWMVPPTAAARGEGRGDCYATIISNTWDREVNITAEHGKEALDISKSIYLVDREGTTPVYTRLEGPLAPGQVAIVFLSHDETVVGDAPVKRCPATVTPALLVDPIRHGTTFTEGFRIMTDAPVSAYAIMPYGGADSYFPTATLLLPATSWTERYIAVSPHDFRNTDSFFRDPDRTLQIIAREDGTEVTIQPAVPIEHNGDVAGGPAGTKQTWSLAKGQVLQLSQRALLTGSPIEATKPVGVFGGAQCTNVPMPTDACDLLQQQIPPLSHWGSEYAVVPYESRIASLSAPVREKVPYTFVGAVSGTVLTYEPSQPRGTPNTLEANQAVSFLTDEVFVVKSQDANHPFHVSAYMTGPEFMADPETGYMQTQMGDPEFVNVSATAQYLDRYVFFTDFTYPDTTLTVVRKKTPRGFEPVELGCGGEITGFSPLGPNYEFAWVRLTKNFRSQKGECGYGRQEARSNGPFAITVWGVGPYASYAYVGGTGLRPINDVKPGPIN